MVMVVACVGLVTVVSAFIVVDMDISMYIYLCRVMRANSEECIVYKDTRLSLDGEHLEPGLLKHKVTLTWTIQLDTVQTLDIKP